MGSYTLRAGQATDIGRVRKENQDSLYVDSEKQFFIVSDGMGGMQAGAFASKVVIKLLPKMICKRLDNVAEKSSEIISGIFTECLCKLNQELVKQTESVTGVEGLGATVVAALIENDCAHIANLGDSRAYLLREGSLRQLTRDHNLADAMVRLGHLTEAEAANHETRNHLTRFLGMPDEPKVDVLHEELQPGDRLLLCTDGLTGMVTDEGIQEIVAGVADLDEACRQLIQAALAEGGKDNVTVVVVSAEKSV